MQERETNMDYELGDMKMLINEHLLKASFLEGK